MIKTQITASDIKKIFGNNNNRKTYLQDYFKYIKSNDKIATRTNELDNQIISTWNYEVSKKIIRKMFEKSDKYKIMKRSKALLDRLLVQWSKKKMGDLKWPFSAMNFDQYVHKLNRNMDLSEKQKDDLISKDAIKFRWIKQINTLRNDYIEYLIFQNENVIPTFGNNVGVDFYIDGMPYDQKVSKSVGKPFEKKYGVDYRKVAIENPSLVAKSLYENQDRERFGREPRLYIVYLDSDVNSEQIEEQLKNINFDEPIEIQFDYTDKDNKTISYQTSCFTVLLHH